MKYRAIVLTDKSAEKKWDSTKEVSVIAKSIKEAAFIALRMSGQMMFEAGETKTFAVDVAIDVPLNRYKNGNPVTVHRIELAYEATRS